MTKTQTLSVMQLNVLNKFKNRIKKERFLNNYASTYYSKQNNKFVIPGILITGISSIASFMATSDILSTDSKQGFSIGVGILTATATIMQSISSSYGFQSRAEQFQKAADRYDSLLTKIEFEIVNPNEDFDDFCNQIESHILDIKNDCNYLPPLFIYNLWKKEKHELYKNNNIDNDNNIKNDDNNVNNDDNNIKNDDNNIKNVTIDNLDINNNSILNIYNENTPLYTDNITNGTNNTKYNTINLLENKCSLESNTIYKDPNNLV